MIKKKLRVGIIDVVAREPEKTLYARVMNANLASIMPQVVGVWAEHAGHEVTYVCYTGLENLVDELPKDVDIVFVSAFTEAAQLAYAISNLFRSRGAVTALGGPHARCYPQDAQKYFDYVMGFTDEELIHDVLAECVPHRPVGLRVAKQTQPLQLPGLRQRWPFIKATLRKAPFIKMVPMLGSLGCPYTCSFCIDAKVPYQPLDFEGIREDLAFIGTRFNKVLIGWHDPNFGIRFDDYLSILEQADPKGKLGHVAESSLAILSEDRLKRMKKAGFQAMLPGVESWYDLGGKSKSRGRQGEVKVEQVSEHIKTILRYIPYVQANFVMGLDSDEGREPFELTKDFIDRTPGAFPGYSLLTAFGEAAPLNLGYQRSGRVLPFPYFFLNNNGAMNVRPANYEWREFYDNVIDLVSHTFSWSRIYRRFRGTRGLTSRLLNFVRAVSSEGFGRLGYYREIRRRLDEDPEFRPFFEQETTKLPQFYKDLVRQGLGPLWEWLPEGAMDHDPNAYLKSQASAASAPAEAVPAI
jgi:hypothetical protein